MGFWVRVLSFLEGTGPFLNCIDVVRRFKGKIIAGFV